MIRVPTSCLATVGLRPVLESIPNTKPPGCPADMACLDHPALIAVNRWIAETLRWMEQVETACSQETENHD